VSGQYASEANAYGNCVYQGAYVFDISTEGISLRGRITHIQDDELLKSGYWFDSDYSVFRSLYIGENLYTISGRMVNQQPRRLERVEGDRPKLTKSFFLRLA
jgi:hypothetical protein